MFLNNLAISWHLLGDSGDYLAIDKSSQRGADGAIKTPNMLQSCHKDAKEALKGRQRSEKEEIQSDE